MARPDLTVLAIPAYIGAMGFEFWWQRQHPAADGEDRPGDYELNDTIASLSMGIGSLVVPLATAPLLRRLTPGQSKGGTALLAVAAAAGVATTIGDVLRSRRRHVGELLTAGPPLRPNRGVTGRPGPAGCIHSAASPARAPGTIATHSSLLRPPAVPRNDHDRVARRVPRVRPPPPVPESIRPPAPRAARPGRGARGGTQGGPATAAADPDPGRRAAQRRDGADPVRPRGRRRAGDRPLRLRPDRRPGERPGGRPAPGPPTPGTGASSPPTATPREPGAAATPPSTGKRASSSASAR